MNKNQNIFKNYKKYTLIPVPYLILNENGIVMFMNERIVGMFCVPFILPELGLVCDK